MPTRSELKKHLALLPEKNQLFFKRMYSHGDLTLDINTVVDKLEDWRLKHALYQVQSTLLMNKIKAKIKSMKR